MNFCTGRIAVIIAISSRPFRIVSFTGDRDCGLYIRGVVNDFKTPLAARGTRAELETFILQHRGDLRTS